MTQVTSGAFTVSVSTFSNPYAGWATGYNEVIDSNGEIDARVMSYSGCAYDPLTGNIYAFGGGHEANNNSVWRFNVDTRGPWTEDYPATHSAYPNAPDTFFGMMADTSTSYPGKWMSVNRPISRHTRRSMGWVAHLKAFTAGSQSTFSGNGEEFWNPGGYGNDPKDNWLYYPETQTWAYQGSTLTDATKQRFNFGALYHSTRRKVYTFDYSGGLLWVVEWNPDTNVWRSHSATRSFSGGVSIALDVTGDRIMMYDGTSLSLYSLATESWTGLTSSGTNPSVTGESDNFLLSTTTGYYTYMKADGDLYKCVVSGSSAAWSSWGFNIPNMSVTAGKGVIALHCPIRGVAFFVHINSGGFSVDVHAAKI